MRPILKQSDERAAFTPLERKPHPLGVVEKQGGGLRSHPSFLTGFTIVELMTVMSVIIILISLLVPGLNALRRYARTVTQKHQFYAIEVALETFHCEWGRYPDSNPVDPTTGQPSCGAMRLAEAMVGKDFLGYSPGGNYHKDPCDLSERRLYLPIEKVNACRLSHVYEPPFLPFIDGDNPTNNNDRSVVLCDAYPNVTYLGPGRGKSIGMPILYYRANTSNTRHNLINPLDPRNIYYFGHNHRFVGLGAPWEPGRKHPLFEDPIKFYEMTVNDQIDLDGDGVGDRPYKADSYILLSAGYDGLYGTDDDIFNFNK